MTSQATPSTRGVRAPQPRRLKVNGETYLREGFRRSPDDVDYAVETPGGAWLGHLEIRRGKLTASCGIGPHEYLQVQRALPRVDFSLWGQGAPVLFPAALATALHLLTSPDELQPEYTAKEQA